MIGACGALSQYTTASETGLPKSEHGYFRPFPLALFMRDPGYIDLHLMFDKYMGIIKTFTHGRGKFVRETYSCKICNENLMGMDDGSLEAYTDHVMNSGSRHCENRTKCFWYLDNPDAFRFLCDHQLFSHNCYTRARDWQTNWHLTAGSHPYLPLSDKPDEILGVTK